VLTEQILLHLKQFVTYEMFTYSRQLPAYSYTHIITSTSKKKL